jgi:hypothetical protein
LRSEITKLNKTQIIFNKIFQKYKKLKVSKYFIIELNLLTLKDQ